MSADDQALSIGRTVLEYVASKRKLAAIRADISRIAKEFEEAAATLRENAGDPGVVNQFLGLPTYDKLRALTDDLRAETRRHEELLASIKGVGLEG